MENQQLQKWAFIAEIVGTLAVVISLIFVIRSINQNTDAIEATELNNIWDAWREAAILPVINDSEFATVYAKASSSAELTDVEAARWYKYQAAQFDIWAQLFDLYSDGLISYDKWNYWDEGYWRAWEESGYSEAWARNGNGAIYDSDFRNYVESKRIQLGL